MWNSLGCSSERGAYMNAKDNDKSTPLHLALSSGHVEFARALVEHGADVNAKDNYLFTPLHLAFSRGYVEFAWLLVEHGANENDAYDRLDSDSDLRLSD
jgi:ankyrin repeat protein